jgi:DNA polymerase/3'-5' exonuclease PolX
MGLCRLSPEHPVRRIDIKVYPADQFAAAQLYFTGSEYFNRAVRFYAKKNGYHLGDKGLFRCDRNHLDEPLNLVKVPCETEAAIFKALGLEYVNPEQRDA